MSDLLKYISPENLFVADGSEDLNNPIVEMSDKKNLLYTRVGSFTAPSFDYPCDLMVSIIYDVETKKIQTRGRVRYHKSGNKQVLQSKNWRDYSPQELGRAKKEVKRMFDVIAQIMNPIDEPTEIEFKIGESQESIIKKMNDSNRFNIAISSAKKE